VDSLKVLDPKRPIREADNSRASWHVSKLPMIGLTRGSKQSRYSDVIGVLCFDCDEKALQPSALLLTCSIQTSFSGKL
jgi:hypothetical protein